MESGITLLESSNCELEIHDDFCEASRLAMRLASSLRLSPDNSSEDQIEITNLYVEMQNFIDMLKSIESKKKSLLEIRHTTEQYLSRLHAKDIINSEVHLKWCQNFEEIIDHMSLVIKESEQLRNRLQSPLMFDALNIHSSHQRYALELFSIISSHFKEIESQLDILHKASILDLKTIENEHGLILLEAKKQIAELQRAVNYLETFRTSLNKLCSLKAQKHLELVETNT